MQTLRLTEIIVFSKFVEKMSRLEIARFFIALLHLAMKEKIDLLQNDDSMDFKIIKKSV
jgi:chromatin segregation and condensation protein Rec8/ScpA/Scc1 (kleisin family)